MTSSARCAAASYAIAPTILCEAEYAIEIDWRVMARMVRKALFNKSKASKFGPVTVYAGACIVRMPGGAQ